MIIICDYAEEINGKIYIQGGGVDRVLAGVPVPMSLAIFRPVPWNETNQRTAFTVQLRDADGTPYPPTEDGQGARLEGTYEVGRAAGSSAGMGFVAKLAVRLPYITFAPGSYEWFLEVPSAQATERAQFVAFGG